VAVKLRGGLKVAAVKAPGFGDRRKAMLEDIAILTGGTMVSADLGIKPEKVTINMLRRAKKVMIDKENTTMVGGAGKKADIQARITQIKAQIEETTSDYAGRSCKSDLPSSRRRRSAPRRRRDRDRGEGAQGAAPISETAVETSARPSGRIRRLLRRDGQSGSIELERPSAKPIDELHYGNTPRRCPAFNFPPAIALWGPHPT
jgi:hypothetical protein